MNWVERRARNEKFIAENKDRIWRDLCNALESAVLSYKELYQGEAETQVQNGHQFRVTVKPPGKLKEVLLDLTFAAPEIRVVCTGGPCITQNFWIHPNQEAPYRSKGQELTADQVSETILAPVFFPKAVSISVMTHTPYTPLGER